MKGKFPAFQFYPDSWLSSTTVSLMSPAEEGAYLRLLCHAWQSDDCGLPDDDAALASLSRLGIRQWNKSSAKIRSKFESLGGRLFNPRLIEERQKQLEWREKSAQGGRKSSSHKSKDINKGAQPPLNHPSTTLEPPLANGCHLVDTKEATNGQPTTQPNGNISSSSSFSSSLEEKQRPLLSFPARWQLDESYAGFVSAWREVESVTAKPLLDEDFAEAHFRWLKLDHDQRLLAIKTTSDHLLLGVWNGSSDPQYIPLPARYLEKEYKRPVVAPKGRESPAFSSPRLDPVAIAKKRAEEMRRDGIR